MAQTTEIAPGLRSFYRRYLSSPTLDRLAHRVIEALADAYARSVGFSFPAKFNWEWKTEMLTERYEKDTVRLFKEIVKPGMRIVDIGAHIGFFSRMFAKLAGPEGKVYCFEADPENYALLRLNTAKFPGVVLFDRAVSDRIGTIDFYHLDASTGCHSIVSPDGASAKKITVPTTTLDAVIAEGAIDRVDLIKIDIEGGEPFAFRGMEKLFEGAKGLKMVAEYNEASLVGGGTTGKDFLAQIEGYGFEISFITARGLVALRDIPEKDRPSYYSRTGYVNLYCEKRDA